MSDKLKGGLTMLTLIVSIALAQAQEVKAVLMDTLKLGNIKLGGTLQVQKDTAEVWTDNMIRGAIDDFYLVDSSKAVRVEDYTRDDMPENVKDVWDQANMAIKESVMDDVDDKSFRASQHLELAQQAIRDGIMVKGRDGLSINVPVKGGDYGSTKGKFNKEKREAIRQYIIDQGYTEASQLPYGKVLSRRGSDGYPATYVKTGKELDDAVTAGQSPIVAQGQVNFTFLHELGHIFGLGHTEGTMKNGTNYLERKEYIASHNGENLSPEQNEELMNFLMEHKVYGLDTLTSINNEIFAESFHLYPNPTGNGYVTIETPNDTQVQGIFITDAQGNRLRQYTGRNLKYDGKTYLGFLGNQAGTFFITILTPKGMVTKQATNTPNTK